MNSLYFSISAEQNSLALESLTRLCILACNVPILVPKSQETLAQLPASALNALRYKEGRKLLGDNFNFIGGCFASKKIKKADARGFAVYLRLIGFDSPHERSTDEEIEEIEELNQPPQQFVFTSPDDNEIYARLMRGTFENLDTIAGILWRDMRGINDRLPIYAGTKWQ